MSQATVFVWALRYRISQSYVRYLLTSEPNLTDLRIFTIYSITNFHRPKYVCVLPSHQISQAQVFLWSTFAPNFTGLGMFVLYISINFAGLCVFTIYRLTKFRRPRYVYILLSHQISQAWLCWWSNFVSNFTDLDICINDLPSYKISRGCAKWFTYYRSLRP